MKKKLAFLLIPIFLASLSAQSFFSEKLNSQELEQAQGESTLIKKIDSYKNISILPNTENTTAIANAIKELKPSLVLEFIKIIPKTQDQTILESLHKILLNIENYAGIQYWSEQQKRYYDLYTSVVVNSTKEIPFGYKLNVTYDMLPFNPYKANVLLKKTDSTLFYSTINTELMKFKGVPAIKKEDFHFYIVAQETEDSVILYGLGAVDAPILPFVKDRIEVSFTNRIKTFCQFIFKEVTPKETVINTENISEQKPTIPLEQE